MIRPYPEWVPDLEDVHWLRKPSKPDPGVPRVLTPPELKEFLENTTADELANLPGGFMMHLKYVKRQSAGRVRLTLLAAKSLSGSCEHPQRLSWLSK